MLNEPLRNNILYTVPREIWFWPRFGDILKCLSGDPLLVMSKLSILILDLFHIFHCIHPPIAFCSIKLQKNAQKKKVCDSVSRIVEEIPGLSKQYDMEFFRNLENKCGIRLENIVYYKVQQLIHIHSLISFLWRTSPTTLWWQQRRIVWWEKESYERTQVTLNTWYNHTRGVQMIGRACFILTTWILRLWSIMLQRRHRSQPTIFQHLFLPLPWQSGKVVRMSPSLTSPTYTAVRCQNLTPNCLRQNACRVRQQRGHRLLLGLVGDSLLEPFWPEGTGIGRGFLGVLDTAWMVRRFCLEGEGDMVYEVIREREKLYSLLR